MRKLEDGRLLMASYSDINEFFVQNDLVGKTISDIIPFCYDYPGD